MDINDYLLTVPGWTKYVEHPKYLYDNSLWNDYEYLYNHDIVVRCVERCVDGLLGTEDNIDTAYTWEDDALFGKQIVLEVERSRREQHLQGKDNIEEAYLVSGVLSDNIEEKLQVCQENLDNILPFLEENPDTKVYVMIPPYSMLYWEEKILSGELENILAIYAYAVEKLLQYDNVRVYYFQNEYDIITNLDNYRDSCHHRPEYNRYMFECIRDGKNEMTLQNYQALFQEMYDFAKDYPSEGGLLINLMKNANHQVLITRAVSNPYAVAHKYGWDADSYHDMALVYGDAPFAVCVMTNFDFSVNDDDLNEYIRSLVAEIEKLHNTFYRVTEEQKKHF